MKAILHCVLSLKIQNTVPIRPQKRARLGINALAVLESYHVGVLYALCSLSRGKKRSNAKSTQRGEMGTFFWAAVLGRLAAKVGVGEFDCSFCDDDTETASGDVVDRGMDATPDTR